MDISEMDPSMLLGFLCQSSNDFDNLCDRFEKVCNKNAIINFSFQLSKFDDNVELIFIVCYI